MLCCFKSKIQTKSCQPCWFFCLQRQVGSNYKFICPHLGQYCCNGRGEQSRGKWWKSKRRTQEAVMIWRKLVEGIYWEDGWSLPILDGWCMTSMNILTINPKVKLKHLQTFFQIENHRPSLVVLDIQINYQTPDMNVYSYLILVSIGSNIKKTKWRQAAYEIIPMLPSVL